jgi:hypothetical protein
MYKCQVEWEDAFCTGKRRIHYKKLLFHGFDHQVGGDKAIRLKEQIQQIRNPLLVTFLNQSRYL